jgi:hypothetical protein
MRLYIATDGAFVKIGISVRPEHRVWWLRTPVRRAYGMVDLVQAWQLPNASEIERHVKRILRNKVVAGAEWFDVTLAELMELVEYLLAIFDHTLPRPKFPALINDGGKHAIIAAGLKAKRKR